jgi:chitosanase
MAEALITTTQQKTAEAIVNIFETSEVRGNYGDVTVIAGDTGHLTFGRSQTTLGSGNLHKLLDEYCANAGARFGAAIAPFLRPVKARDVALDTETYLHNLLRASADDPVMRDTQDVFFDQRYWQPAARAAANLRIVTPLGVAVVYDSHVHGSWATMRDRTKAAVGSVTAAGEHSWISTYVATRREWLANHEREDLRKTAYRMDAFRSLIDQNFWSLALPLVVRGKEISLASLAAAPAGCYEGPQPGTRLVAVQTPLLRGLDVRLAQLGLSKRGVVLKADGIFGQTSSRLVRQYQIDKGLPATGVINTKLIAELIS